MGCTLCALFDPLPDSARCYILSHGELILNLNVGAHTDDLRCLFFTALLLQRSQPMLVQENQPVKDIDLTCLGDVPNQ